MPKRNPEPQAAEARTVPGWAPQFGTRLQTLYEAVGGITKASAMSGVGLETLASWRDGKSRPAFLALASLAEAARMSLDWLATGAPAGEAGVTRAAPADPEPFRLLGRVRIDQLVDANAEALRQMGVKPRHDQQLQMHLTVLLYDALSQRMDGEDPDPAAPPP